MAAQKYEIMPWILELYIALSNVIISDWQQVGFIADDQFGVLETHVLDDLECKHRETKVCHVF